MFEERVVTCGIYEGVNKEYQNYQRPFKKDFNIRPLGKDEAPKIGDEDVYINCPDDDNEDGISIEDFLDYTCDLESLTIEDDSTVRMGGIRQTILNVGTVRKR